jgi:Derlin-2/3
LAAVTFIFSLLAYTGVLDFNTFVLIPKALIKLPPELWRLVTPFIMTEGHIGIFFDTYFRK